MSANMSPIRQSVAETIQHAKAISANVKDIVSFSVQIAILKLIRKLQAKHHACLFRAFLKATGTRTQGGAQ